MCILHTNLKTRFEYGISHLVFLACYYHTNGTKSSWRLHNLCKKHKLSGRNVKRVMSRDCHVINLTFNNIFYIQYCPKLFFIIVQHLLFGEYSRLGPRIFNVSHHSLICFTRPAPLASFAKQHCLTVDAACRHL